MTNKTNGYILTAFLIGVAVGVVVGLLLGR